MPELLSLAQQRHQLDARAGGRERAEELSFDPRFAGADQCRGRRDSVGANGLPAESRRARAGESRDPEQRLRHAAAAERDSFDVWSGDRVEQFGTAWGSAIGGLVTWEPFDFGLRRANVAVANAARAQSEAALKRTQFDVAVAAADAYVTLVAAQETVRAAQAGVDRAEVSRTIMRR